MSTVNNEPNYGAPQTLAGANMIGQPAPIAQAAPQAEAPAQMMQPQYTPEQITYFQQMQAQQAAVAAQTGIPAINGMTGNVGSVAQDAAMQQQAQPTPAAQQSQQMQGAPAGMPPLNIPGQAPAQQLPTIQDNNPVAELPQNGAAPVGMNPINQQQTTVAPIGNMGAPAGMPGMHQAPAGYNPMMQQQGMTQQQAPAGYNPMQGQQAPAQQQQYNPMMQQQGMPGMQGMQQMQPMPGQQMQQQGYGQQQAPGASNQSYLQQQGGMFGPTPTGHPEKTKFQGQAILVHVTNRVTSKGNLMTTGLFNPNPGDRNSAAVSFVCFSGSAANQIEILNNPVIKAQYTNLPQAKGQTIYYEGSWEWDTKGKTHGWKCMMDNFVFVNDQNFRNLAESYVPPVPASPMDMLNGGNMQMGMMQQQSPMGGMQGQPQAGFGAPAGMGYNPMQGQPQYNPMGQQQNPMGGMPGMGQQQNPYQHMQQQAPMGQQQGMPGMGQMPAYPGMTGIPGQQ